MRADATVRRDQLRASLITDPELAASLIRDGKLVAFATETVYGLGGNALDPLALARIFAAKDRPHFDPLIVHLADAAELDRYATDVPDVARRLAARFWPGPLTLVLPKREVIPDLATAGLSTVAVRVPATAQARAFISAAGVPIAAPSANLFGSVSPTTAEHVLQGLGDRIDAVLEGGACSIGVESTVLACFEKGPPRLLRPGGLTIEEIEAAIGPILRNSPLTSADNSPQVGPGLLSRHYAPAKPIEIVAALTVVRNWEGVGLLSFGALIPAQCEIFEELSSRKSLTEAAAHFFAALRRLESTNIHSIVAQWFPNTGLGLALNDRLRRAAVKGE